MATFKICVKNLRVDKTYNVKIRVTHNRKSIYISTPYYINHIDLTKGGKIKRPDVISVCENIIREYQNKILQFKHLDTLVVSDLVELLTKREVTEPLDFFTFGDEFITSLKTNGRENTAKTYVVALNSFRRFVGRRNLDVREIDKSVVRKYLTYLAETKKGERNSRCFFYVSKLSALHCRMVERYNDIELDVILIKSNPFLRVELPERTVTANKALTIAEVRKIIGLRDQINDKMTLAIEVFILSFCLCGMNLCDLYACTDFKKGRIIYQRSKTKRRRKDNAEISILVESEIDELVEKYRDLSGQRVFNFYQTRTFFGLSQMLSRQMLKIRELLTLDANFSFYSARHSWATIARNDARVNKYDVHQALNHADRDMAITDIYIKKDWSEIDIANRKVLDLVFEKEDE